MQSELIKKSLFVLLSVTMTIIWSIFGTPKSAKTLTGMNKLFLEVIVYGIGIISCYYLFGGKIASIYGVIAVMDLLLFYVFKLEKMELVKNEGERANE